MHRGFPGGSASKAAACSAGDPGLIPGLGRSPGEGNGNPLQDSCLENSMEATVHRVIKSHTWLSDFTFTLCVVFIRISQSKRQCFRAVLSSQQHKEAGTEICPMFLSSHMRGPPLAPTQWYFCYIGWFCTNRSLSRKVRSLHEDSLLVLCVLWVLTNVWWHASCSYSITDLKVLFAQPVFLSFPQQEEVEMWLVSLGLQ